MHDRVSPLRPVPSPETGSVDITDDEPDTPDLASIIERAYLIAIGAASLAVTAVVEAVARSIDPAMSPTDEDDRSMGLPAVAGATFGAAVQAGTLAVRAGVSAIRTTSGLASVAIGSLIGAERSRWLQDRLTDLDDRGRRERNEAEGAAASFTDVFVPTVVDAVLDRVDLTALVAERLNLDAVVTQLDVDRVVGRVDLRRAIDRISVDEIAARLDVDAVAARIDVQAIVDRLDLVGIAQGVIDELDLPEMMREATGAMSAETVDSIRIRGMDADRLVTRLVDRVLSRRSDDVATAASAEPGDL